jgi:hypothetical protein
MVIDINTDVSIKFEALIESNVQGLYILLNHFDDGFFTSNLIIQLILSESV